MRPRLRPTGLVAVVFAAALTLMVGLAIGVPLNHDEHQFIASAALVAREGLLPYRDFPYFHTPVLVGVYALLFHASDHLLLTARLFSVLCAWATAIALFAFAWRNLEQHRHRVLLALGLAVAFLANPVAVYTYPKAWNNAAPTLLAVLAFLAQCHGAATARGRWFFASGALVALAAGMRISFAPLAAPFLLLAAFTPPGQRLRFLGLSLAGMAAGALPTLAMFAAAPGSFLFDTLVYNSRVNAAYRLASGDERSALASKGLFLLKVLVNPGNAALLLVGFGLAVWRGLRAPRGRRDYPLALLLAITPFLLLGVFAPTPSYSQYYFVLSAFAALGVAIVIPAVRFGPAIVGALAALSVLSSAFDFRNPRSLFAAGPETPLALHATGVALRNHVDRGPVLTVAPIVPLEGGLSIVPAFATGSFAWRTAPFLSAEDRARHGFLIPGDLPGLTPPPTAVLLGFDRKREAELKAFAESRGDRRIKLPDKRSLFVLRHSQDRGEN